LVINNQRLFHAKDVLLHNIQRRPIVRKDRNILYNIVQRLLFVLSVTHYIILDNKDNIIKRQVSILVFFMCFLCHVNTRIHMVAWMQRLNSPWIQNISRTQRLDIHIKSSLSYVVQGLNIPWLQRNICSRNSKTKLSLKTEEYMFTWMQRPNIPWLQRNICSRECKDLTFHDYKGIYLTWMQRLNYLWRQRNICSRECKD